MADKKATGGMRITDEELAILKATFAEKEDVLKLMRKIFLPEVDMNAPIGSQIDLWMTIPIEDKTPEEAIMNLKARNQLISHVEMCLSQINILAGKKDESAEQTKNRLAKDSSK